MSRGHDRERLVRQMLEVGLGPDVGDPVRFQRVDLPPVFIRPRPWLPIRAAGSLGDVDVAALRPGLREPTPITGQMLAEVLLIEVKSTAGGPYERFGPAARDELRAAAELAGAEAWEVWIPPPPPGVRGVHGCWIPEADWPG